ncbi:MAG: TonB-dependent siderophore receptor [Paracoccaceae bacterium]
MAKQTDRRTARFSPRRGKRIAVAALLSGTALIQTGPARAQAADEGDVVVLDEIRLRGASVMAVDDTIVAGYTATGSKTPTEVIDIPAQVSIVTQKEMQTRRPENLSQALSYTSSVSVDEYGSDNRYDFYRIRGFLQTGTGTYRDSLPLRSFNFTSVKIEPYSVQRIEVLKGSTSTLFGLNAPGGLVNVITKRPQADPFGEVYATIGQDHAEIGFDMGAPLDADGVWTYRLTAKVQDAEEGGDYLNDDRKYLGAALTWKPTDATALTLLANYTEFDGNAGNSTPVGSTASRGTYFGEPEFNKLDRRERSIGYEFSHEFGNGLTFRQNLRYSSFDFDLEQVYIDSVAGSTVNRGAYGVDGNVKRLAVDNQLQYDATIGTVASRTLFGVEYVRDELLEGTDYMSAPPVDIDDPVYCGLSCVTYNYTLTNDLTQKSTGIYLQEELTFADRWILTMGARHDRVETDDASGAGTNAQSAWTKKIGLTYKATEDLAFYGNYSESFQPVEAGYLPYMTVPAKPQEGRQYEIGAKYRPGGGDALLGFALFDLSQTNVPRYATVGGIPAYWQIGRIDVKGAEIEGRVAMNDNLNLNFAYAYWDAEIVNGDYPGNRPLLTPKHTASVWADYTFDQGSLAGLRIGGGARLLGERYSDDANTVRIGSSVVFDIMASYQIAENTELGVNVSNLFDRQYVASYNFTNTAIYYGDERTIRATLRHSW